MNLLIELDKAGAEWVVVAYLTGDENMLAVVESGKSPHVVTGALISKAPEEFVIREEGLVKHNTDPTTIEGLREPLLGEIDPAWFLPRIMSIRQMGKKSNHGLNYNLTYKGFALHNEIEEKTSKMIVDLYHKQAYPGIRLWYKEIQEELQVGRSLVNCFDRKCRFMDAWGDTIFNQGYAFKPQSTIFDLNRQGLVKGYADQSPAFQRMEILQQVHDSITIQVDHRDAEETAEIVVKMGLDYMNDTCSYRGRDFKVGTTMEIGFNLGGKKACVLDEDITTTAKAIEQTIKRLQDEASSQ
jgi:hypothetical protein